MSAEVDLENVKKESQQEGSEPGNAASSLWSGKKEDIPGTPTPERPGSSASSSSNAEDCCTICLGKFVEKCVTNSCLHSFCLVCLKQWAKQNAVCPLCKVKFSKILYDIKSDTDYKEWEVPQPEPRSRDEGAGNFREFLNVERRRFFGYRTTHFPGAAALQRLYNNSHQSQSQDAIPSVPYQRRPRYQRMDPMYRLSIYQHGIWALPLPDVGGFRESSPRVYREQPELLQRITPWINRELAALVPPSRVGVVLTEVLDLIERVRINSSAFRRAMVPHLGRWARHFAHEFYQFARSPFDMVGFDNTAQYAARYHQEDSGSEDSSSSDSDTDAVVEIDSAGNPIASTSTADGSRGQAAPVNVAREETLTQEGSVVISSSGSSSSTSSSNSEESHNGNRRRRLKNASVSHTSILQPPPNWRQKLRTAVNNLFENSVVGGSTAGVNNGASGSNANPSQEDLSSDSSDCMIVDLVAPRAPTPVLIEIDSDNENKHASGSSVDRNRDKLSSKVMVSKLPPKCKPVLKRNNFQVNESSAGGVCISDSDVSRQDHSYCTEERSSSALPSTSAAASVSFEGCQGSSQKVDSHCSSSQESCPKELIQENSPSESSESDISLSESSESSPTKWRKIALRPEKRKLYRSSVENFVVSAKRQRSTREHNVSITLPKKDLKGKVKSSSSSHRSSRPHLGATAEVRRRVYECARAVEDSSSDSSSVFDTEHRKPRKSHHREAREAIHKSLERASERKKRTSRSRYIRKSHVSGTEDSGSDTKPSHHKKKMKHKSKTDAKKKSPKKSHKKSKDRRQERHKKKRSKHKKRSKGRHESDSEHHSEYRKKKVGHRRKRSSRASPDTESDPSFVRFKETTLKLKIKDQDSSYSSDF